MCFIGVHSSLFGPAYFGTDENSAQRLRSRASKPVYRSHAESYGFFPDIRDADWCRLKHRARNTPNHLRSGGSEQAPAWYQNNWEPTFTCFGEKRQGMGDGPKWICDPHRLKTIDNCVVYSIGSNNEFDFESNFIHETNCEIHTFDPTSSFSNKPPGVTFHQYGLADKSYGRYKTLQDITQQLGHTHIDIFKIDCEGCEWATFQQWFEHMQPTQVLVELHSGTTGASPVPAERFMRYMRKHGYAVFHKEPNTLGCGGSMH